MKFANNREIKDGDKVVGLGHQGHRITGAAVPGSKALGQREFVFKSDAHDQVHPSLNLSTFLHEDDAKKVEKATESPTPKTAAATTAP